MPARMIVNSNAKTVRNSPSKSEKCRSHTISIPIDAKPVSASATLVSASSDRADGGRGSDKVATLERVEPAAEW